MGLLAGGDGHGARDELVADVVRKLSEEVERASWDLVDAVGRLVIESFYGGNLRAWRSRRRADPSFRQLAAHPGLPMSASALYRAVSVYEIRRRLGADDSVDALTPTHFAAVIGLSDDEQVSLLGEALREQMSTRQLEVRVRGLREGRRRQRGRPRVPMPLKALRRVHRDLESLGASVDVPAEVEPEAQALLKSSLERLRELEASHCGPAAGSRKEQAEED